MAKSFKRSFRLLIAIMLGLSLVFTSLGGSAEAAPSISKLSDEIVTTEALTDTSFTGYMNGESFQQDGIVTYNGWQYTAFWSSDRHVNIARKQLPSGSWQTLKLTDYQNSVNDSHNTISVGISPLDGTIHLSFDHHNSTMHYRKSVSGLATNPSSHVWEASKFNAVTNQLTGTAINDVTYPRFITAPNGRLQLFFRTGLSGDGDTQMYEYNGSTGLWTSLGMFIQSSNATPDVCPYYFGFDYDSNGRLHVSWTWRDTFNGNSNHNIMYVYSDDNGRTWKNNAGTMVGTTGSNYITPTTSGINVWNIPQNRGLINQESQTVDHLGRVHIAASHMPDSEANDSDFTRSRNKSYVFHYWRDTNGTWSRSQIPHLPGISRSDIGVDTNNNVYMVMPSSLDGATRIASANASTAWTDWQIIHSEPMGRFASEPLIDHGRLQTENILSFVQPEIGNGKIAVLDFQIAGSQVSTNTNNMAISAVATASSSSIASSNANDGNAFSRWNAGSGTSGNQWLEIDLGSVKTINKVVLKEAIYRITSYNLQYHNGSSWINITSGTSLGHKTLEFSDVITNKVRLLINSTSGSSATIYEFEVYGSNIVSGTTYNLVNVSSGKALDVWNLGTANGTNVAIYTFNNNAAQKWTIIKNTDGTYKLINPNSGKALDVYQFGTQNGTNVAIWTDFNNAAQKWDIIKNSDGSYRLINPNSNKALDAAGINNGDNVQIWEYSGNSNQHWNIVPAN